MKHDQNGFERRAESDFSAAEGGETTCEAGSGELSFHHKSTGHFGEDCQAVLGVSTGTRNRV
ncbi:hypothetical protein Hoch_1124 [Haliangium ochraceum DSM 14365]|uniref:Uncharacterized protein n=1 Tax=Haliangium ochraceum (strain DSM 14365 / JCM 11303 / SMP-2) TaxID=502025 RepID=D0LS06_HALO1|nr:hypothetical protein Hoch_1124 [Haliangium ochraceum DSM 14365]